MIFNIKNRLVQLSDILVLDFRVFMTGAKLDEIWKEGGEGKDQAFVERNTIQSIY